MVGLFIVIDGIDGCGKTTQSKMLVQSLSDMKFSTIHTAEPTHGEFGSIFRSNLLSKKYNAVIDALCVAADRVDHCESLISPSLEENKIVVSDRYLDSGIVYQSVQDPSGVRVEWLKAINKFCVEPDLVIILDIPSKEALLRINSRGEEKSKFENMEFLNKIRTEFRKRIAFFSSHKTEYVIINVGGLSVDELHRKIMVAVLPFLSRLSPQINVKA